MNITTVEPQSMRRWCEVATKEKKKKRKESRKRCNQSLDLALDINLSKRGVARTFEEGTGFASQKRDVVRSVFQQVLTLLIDDKLGSISIRLETEFLSDEAKFDIRLVAAN